MLVTAHAGHWLVSLIYVAPVLVLGGALAVAHLRDRLARRREGRAGNAPRQRELAPATVAPPGHRSLMGGLAVLAMAVSLFLLILIPKIPVLALPAAACFLFSLKFGS